MDYDILIFNGILADPTTGLLQKGAIGIKNGKIAAVGDQVQGHGLQEVDAQGSFITPGLIDYHIHVFTGGCEFSLLPEVAAVPNGITTMVDGGSSGVSGFEGFYRNL